ncbi:MAG: pentapeptide repeat-containing protein [Planctomycetota bacterium]|jgi:hypothetical protein
MSNKEHLAILKEGVKAWNKWRQRNIHIIPSLSKANLSEVYLRRANFSQADLLRANLSGADLGGAKLNGAKLRWADLSGADLSRAKLSRAKLFDANLNGADLDEADLRSADLWTAILEKANLNNADLRHCQLIECDLTGAVLTGVKLYGTARDNWIIKDVECKYVYWDPLGEQRSPKDRDLEPGEFERLYAQLPTIEYVFENGMTPIDPLIMDRVVQAIREKKPEFDIKIDSINARGLAPSIKFTVQQEEQKEAVLNEVKSGYTERIVRLEKEKDQLYNLLSQAIDKSGIKLIAAGPGSIVATDGSTVSIEQHIHNALDLQRVIANEPEESESFGKLAKKKALDIIGGAIEDFAKGQIKEAAKQIVELGKDIGPVILNTAAYAFFKSMFGQ